MGIHAAHARQLATIAVAIVYVILMEGRPTEAADKPGGALRELSARRPEEWREPPLTRLAVKRSISVRDFGAIPDGRTDCAAAIQRAFDEATKDNRGDDGEGCEVRFERGVYLLGASDSRKHCLTLRRARGIVIEGAYAELRLLDPLGVCLNLSGCRDTIVRNLTVDYQTPPMTQGVVRAVDVADGALTVDFDPAFPDLSEPCFAQAQMKCGFVKDHADPLRYRQCDSPKLVLRDWRRVAPHRYEIRVAPASRAALSAVAPGDPYVQVVRIDGAQFVCVGGDNVTFENVHVACSRAAAFIALDSSRLAFLRCRVAPPADRWQATAADGVFVFGGRVGPWIEGCEFDALGDDALILKTWRGMCVAQPDERTFDIVKPVLRFEPQTNGGVASPRWPVEPGDTIEVFDPQAGRVVGRWRARERQYLTSATRVVMEEPHSDARIGLGLDRCAFFNLNNTAAGFVIRNNVVRNSYRYGLLLKSHDGLVENNRFEGQTGPAVLLANTEQEYGGVTPHRTVLRDNVFRDSWRAANAWGATLRHYGAVSIGVTRPEGRYGVLACDASRDIHDLVIEANRIEHWNRYPALAIVNARGVLARDNTFEAPGADAGPAIRVENADNVRLEGNRLPDGAGAGVEIDTKTTSDVVQVPAP